MSTDTDTDRDLRPRRSESAKSVMLTVLGEFVLPGGGQAWTGTLVGALATLGYQDRNARQVLARLRDDGRIRSERVGRQTRWHLTAEGRSLLEAGAERIYRFGRRAQDWDGRWLLVQCSVPEVMPAALEILKRAGKPFGAYANGFTEISEGFLSDAPTVDALTSREDMGPDAYADHVMGWINQGATIVGGCCEVGPAHIAEITRRVRRLDGSGPA